MKAIWTIVGVLVIVILVAMIYNKGKRNSIKENLLANLPRPTTSPAPVATTKTEAVIVNPTPIVVTPIIVTNLEDCRSLVYQNNLTALESTYLTARAAYQAELSASGPNVIALHGAMNSAYNAWMNERRKCIIRY